MTCNSGIMGAKIPHKRRATALLLAIGLLAAAPAAAFDERIIFDPYTGLSIGGYDPVAYFAENAARKGAPDIEIVLGDTYWHFVNKGNADAFRSTPQVYIPAFGGYSPSGIAKGVPQPGSPTIFTIHKGRLFFFSSEDERRSFLNDPDTAIAEATARWPEVVSLLAY